MKKAFTTSRIFTFIFLLALLGISFQALNNASGPPAARTGAPSESNCTVGCHSGTVITGGTNWSNITLTTNIPAGGYTPGTVYTITLRDSQTSIIRYGFQVTVLDGSGNMAGSFTAGTGSSIQTSGGRSYLNHNSAGTSFPTTAASWTFAWTAPSPGVATVTFYTTINATNNDGNTTGDQIYTKSFAFTQLGVGPPTAVITTTPNPPTVCAGDTVYFFGSGNNNPTSYSWNFGINAVPQSSTVQNPKVVYTTAGTVNAALVTTNAFGSSPFTTKPITVNAKPSAIVTPSGNLSLCGANDSIILAAPAGTGLTYLWNPGNQTTQSITVKTAGTYKVTVTNSNSCSATSSNIIVTARSLPVVTLTSSADSICQGDSVNFTGSGSFATYKFLKDTQTVQNTSSNNFKTNSLLSSNSFTVIATDVFGCKSLPGNSKSVIVRAPVSAPVVTCGASTSGSVQFSWSPLSAAIGYDVSADTGKTWNPPSTGVTGLTHTVAGLTGGTLVNVRVRANTAGACAHGLQAGQTCQTLGCPYVSFVYSGVKTSCLSSDTALNSENISITNVNAIKYSVNISNTGYSSALSTSVSISKGLNNIHIKILDSLNTGCPQTDSIITVTGINSPSVKPVLSFSISAPDTSKQFCANAVQTLFSSNPTGAGRYAFMRNAIDTIQYGNANSYLSTGSLKKYNNNDIAFVIAMDTVYGCFKISDPLKVIVNSLPKAAFGYAALGLTLNFSDSSSGKIKTWNWNFGDASSPSIIKNPSHAFAISNSYNVSLLVTDSNGCGDSTGKIISVTNTGINNLTSIDELLIYPNPAGDQFNISFELKEPSPLTITIFDMNGREVYNLKNENEVAGRKEIPIQLDGFHQGIYLMMMSNGQTQKIIKFIKE